MNASDTESRFSAVGDAEQRLHNNELRHAPPVADHSEERRIIWEMWDEVDRTDALGAVLIKTIEPNKDRLLPYSKDDPRSDASGAMVRKVLEFRKKQKIHERDDLGK